MKYDFLHLENPESRLYLVKNNWSITKDTFKQEAKVKILDCNYETIK